jgi:hypothetical protein
MTAIQVGWRTVAVLAVSVISTTPAQAYLDPGTGSMILQATIGAIAGGLVLVKIYWGKIKRLLFARWGSKPAQDGKLDGA